MDDVRKNSALSKWSGKGKPSLLFMCKLLSEDMYCFIENENLLPEEEKGYRRKSKETKDELLIDKTILKDCIKRRTNIAMGWIDYRKAYDFLPNSCIFKCLDMLPIADDVRRFLRKAWTSRNLFWIQMGRIYARLNRSIFEGDSLSPLVFVICMIILSLLLRRVKVSYEWDRGEFNFYHLHFMNDLNLFLKSDDQIDSL